MGIEEYKAYTRQLENDVGKWPHAYDALMVERNYYKIFAECVKEMLEKL